MNDHLINNIEIILNKLNIDFENYGNRIVMSCPLHMSDKNDSLSVLVEGHTAKGIWKCWTNNCEMNWGQGLFHLIRGILSQDGVEKNNFFTRKWIENLLGNIPQDDLSLNNYLKLVQQPEKVEVGKITRPYIRKNLKRPATILAERNYPDDLLDKYDIGVCYQKRQMYLRTVIPVYDEKYEYMVGCIGRTPAQLCQKCSLHHFENRPCPSNPLEKKWAAKWINSDFYSGNYLFNLWFARKNVYETGKIILVEGALDSLRLEQANITNSVGLFGAKLTDQQHQLINNLPVHTIIIATDNDKAGELARTQIEEKTNRYFNIKHIRPIKKDWSEQTVEEIQNIFKDIK